MDFWIGVLAGIVVLAFFIGATKNNKEYEIYMEGFLAGKESKEHDRNN